MVVGELLKFVTKKGIVDFFLYICNLYIVSWWHNLLLYIFNNEEVLDMAGEVVWVEV